MTNTAKTSNLFCGMQPDYLGSVEWVTDSRGEPYQPARPSFSEGGFFLNTAWGRNLENQRAFTNKSFVSRFRFNGKELDPETGNYYYGARYYDPEISVWLSVDPLAMDYQNLPLTPYHFSANNPITYIDPDGLNWYLAQGKGDQAKPIWFDTEAQAQEHFGDQEFRDLGEEVHSFNSETGNQVYYGNEGESFEFSQMLSEVEIDGGKMSDHARAVKAGRELGVYAAHARFIDGTIAISGEMTENTGTAVSWIGIVTLQPELVTAGEAISRVGTGIKIVGDLRNGNMGSAIERAAIETVVGGLGTGIKSVSGSILDKSILEGSLEAKKTIYTQLISPNLSSH